VSKGSYEIRSVIVLKFHPIGGAMKQLRWTDCLKTLSRSRNNFLSTLLFKQRNAPVYGMQKWLNFALHVPLKLLRWKQTLKIRPKIGYIFMSQTTSVQDILQTISMCPSFSLSRQKHSPT
jgi:hypothetical protein